MSTVGNEIGLGVHGVPTGESCFWCARSDREVLAERGDGVEVMQCKSCGHRAVKEVTIDLEALYQDDSYFRKQSNAVAEIANEGNFGYSNYEEVSFADWNAEFFSALFLLDNPGVGAESQSVLDVGCATGAFLDMAKAFGFKTMGVEPSLWAQEKCTEKGHQIVASTAESPAIATANANVITAFHVVEHLTNLAEFFATMSIAIEHGSKVLAVFPNVNFQQENWSGKHDSFEHISYFEPEFVDREFRKRLPGAFEVLHGPDLVYCFAGKLSRAQLDAIAAVRDISAWYAVSDREDNGRIIHQEKNQLWLQTRLKSFNLASLVFVVNFVARNHSADLAKEILEAVKGFPQWSGDKAWLSFCYALVHRQNGNVYGAASYLGQLPSNQLQSKPDTGLAYLTRLVLDELPRLLPCQNDKQFPVVSVWVNDVSETVDIEGLFQSIGAQTYPYIQVLVFVGDASKKRLIPERYKRLVQVVETAGKSSLEIWQDACSKSSSEIVLLTNGQYAFSEYCLFAMYYPLINNPNSIITVGVRDCLTQPTKIFPGQRLIEQLIGKRFTLEKDSSKAPPFVMFNRNSVSWDKIGLDIICDPVRFEKYLQNKQIVVCPEVLGWLQVEDNLSG